MRKRLVHRRGFTILEVIATMLFIGIAIPAIMEGFSIGSRAAGEAKRKVEAAELAQGKLNELIVLQTWNSGAQQGDFGTDFPGYRWAMSQQQRNDYNTTDMTELTVRVSYQLRGQERYVDVSTIVYTPATTSTTSGTGT